MKAAIYSRKSRFTGKGDSIENQVQLCREYGADRLGITEFFVYEDEGFSGGTTNRPKFKELLKDVKANKFDVLICYRLDRISRNVADFSTTLELLQKHDVSFVSIKEQFDTTTPMGRAMVYISSVFAQLERETIAERIKDNMYELAKSGRWLGGQSPLGFDSEKEIYLDKDYKERSLVKLIPNEEELKKVEFLFNLYHKKKSIHKVLKECLSLNMKGKNGGDMHVMSIRDILKNPVYVKSNKKVMEFFEEKGCITAGTPKGQGLLTYAKVSKGKDLSPDNWIVACSRHKGIIEPGTWLEIQHSLEMNSKPENKRLGTSNTALLSGVLKCGVCGSPMRISYGRERKDGTKNFYYMCTMKAHSGKTRCNNPNAPGPDLQQSIFKKIAQFNKDYLTKEFNETKVLLVPDNKRLDSIKKEIGDIEKKINTLLSKLSLAEDTVSKYILDEIKRLDADKEKLSSEMDNIKKENSELEVAHNNLEITLNLLTNFNDTYESLNTITERRRLLESVIDTIYWDGNTYDTEIYYWGSKKKVLR